MVYTDRPASDTTGLIAGSFEYNCAYTENDVLELAIKARLPLPSLK